MRQETSRHACASSARCHKARRQHTGGRSCSGSAGRSAERSARRSVRRTDADLARRRIEKRGDSIYGGRVLPKMSDLR